MRRYGRWKSLATRRVVLVGLVVLALVLGASSFASAANFYWYGEGNSNCWQTGQPGVSSSACDGVGEWFLNSSPPGRTLEGALDGDLGLNQSGDYCNAYNLNEGPLYTRDTNNESGLTGFNPSSPDTMSDGHGDVCQALGGTWGQGLRPTAAVTSCTPCGMQHYVSFASQNGGLRPWSHAFVGPALVIEAAVYPQIVKASHAWGYLCPVIEQVGSPHGNLLEYCFVEWTKGWGLPPEGQVVGSADADGHTMDEIRTDFALGTNFSVEIAGSANSYVYGEHPWIGPFKAAIREENLLAAIKDANARYGTGFSENPAEYAVIGVEQGTEELGAEELGEKTENLQLRTEYASLRLPTVTTTAASGVEEIGVQEAQATLNGTLNPNAVDTHYYFQYGTTASYGSIMPALPGRDAGSSASGPVSIPIAGLSGGTTYHYRLVASSVAGTTYGNDQAFTTPLTPYVDMQVINGVTETALEGPNHTLWQYLATSGGWKSFEMAGEGTTYSSPQFTVANGATEVMVQGAEHTLWQYLATSEGWKPFEIAGPNSTFSNPVLQVVSGTTEMVVEGPNHTLWQYLATSGGWKSFEMAGEGTTYSSPQFTVANGATEVMVQGAEHTLWQYLATSEGWKPFEIAGPNSTFSNPVLQVVSGTTEMFVGGSNDTLIQYLATSEGWRSLVIANNAFS
jgi:hypothetical protein